MSDVDRDEDQRWLTRFGYSQADVERGRRWHSRREARDARRRSVAAVLEREPARPVSFGLTAREIRAEADRMHRLGFAAWEIRSRLIDPRRVAA